MSFTQVSLAPTPGFCIKSTTLEPGLLPPPAALQNAKTSTTSSKGLLEPAAQPIPVPKGMKTFVNICYDKNVPAPPEASEEAIQRAIQGANLDELLDEEGLKESLKGIGKVGNEEEEEWYVPVVVSEPRVDKDKAGQPSLVVDCVYHSEVRKRTLRDPKFKVFLVELGLQRIEAQTGLTLSRHIGTPNIASKGKLESRTVRIPTALLLHSSQPEKKAGTLTPAQQAVADIAKSGVVKAEGASALDRLLETDDEKEWDNGRGLDKEKGKEKLGRKALIEEVESAPAPKSEPLQPKSILKKSSLGRVEVTSRPPLLPLDDKQKDREKDLLIPLDVSWSWEKLEDSGRLRVTIRIPDLTASSIISGQTFLEIEPLRILLTLPSPNGEPRTVDINRTLPDAQLAVKIKERARTKAERVRACASSPEPVSKGVRLGEMEEEIMAESEKELEMMLYLKREREFDVDGAKAQWIVKDRKLVITL